MKCHIIVLLALFWIVQSSTAQIYKYIRVTEGLSNCRVFSIQKDQSGYMWFLTYTGIDRYDGKNIKHYRLSSEKGFVTISSERNILKTDSYGRIWTISMNGEAFLYNSLTDRFEEVPLPEEIKQHHITIVDITSFNEIWFCSSNQIFIYYIDSKKVKPIELQHSHKQITCIYQAQKNSYFIGTNDGICQATIQRNLLIPTKILTSQDSFSSPRTIYYHQHSNRLLAGNENKGMLIYDLTLNKIEKIYTNLKDFPISSICSYGKDQVLISTRGAGVFRYIFRDSKLENYLMADYSESNKMNGNNIQAIYIDEDKRIWMSVYPIGITLYDERYPNYKWIKHLPGNLNSLGNSQVNSILEDYEGDIWYATNNGISIYNTKNNTWKHLLDENDNDEGKNCTFLSICEIRPGIIAVGGYMSGVFLIDKKTMKTEVMTPFSFEHYSSPKFLNKYIRTIYKDSKGLIWTGGQFYLGCTDYDNKIFNSYFVGYPITCIIEKDSTYMFIGTSNGLYNFNKQTKKMKRMRVPFSSQYINTLYFHTNGDLYIGTNHSGLIIFRPNGEYKIYTDLTSSLLSNNIYTIIPKDNNYLLISSEQNLLRFDIRRERFYNWTEDQGLITTNFNPQSGIHTSDGTFIFGCGNGAIQFNDSTRLPRYNKTKILIDKILIAYKDITTYSSIKQSNISCLDSIKKLCLEYDQNAISIQMSSINYDNPSHTFFQWKLKGINDNWTRTEKDNWIQYSNLEPGEYLLQVQSVSEEDFHILGEKEIKIIIYPSFWYTWWALIIYLLIMILVIAIISQYTWMRNEQKFTLEKLRLFVNAAHDIRTPLSLIKAPIKEVLQNEKLSSKGYNYLHMAVYNSDNLYQTASNILNIEQQNHITKLHVTEYNINKLMQQYVEQFTQSAALKNISINYKNNAGKLNVWIDKKKMDSIFYNLLSNTIKYTPSNGYINIRTTHNDKKWKIEISDSNIKTIYREPHKYFKSFYQGSSTKHKKISKLSTGLSIVEQLVKNHHGTIWYERRENSENAFVLNFPLNNRKFIKHKMTDTEYEVFASEHILFPTIPILNLKEQTTQNIDKEILGHILIVEDNIEVISFLDNALCNEWEITTAHNGKIALELIKENHPDIIISDIPMPEMRGDELCSILKSNITTSHIPIILLTNVDDRDSIIHGFKLRADHYVTKPFDLHLVRAILLNILENRKLLQERLSQVDIVHNLKEIKNANVEQEAKFLTEVKNTIKEHTNDSGFTVDTLCSLMGMSRTSLYSKVKALTNQSLSDMIRDIRMQQSCELLLSKRYTIMEVSDMMRFSEPKYFREVFKKYFGVSPSEYIKTNLKNDNSITNRNDE